VRFRWRMRLPNAAASSPYDMANENKNDKQVIIPDISKNGSLYIYDDSDVNNTKLRISAATIIRYLHFAEVHLLLRVLKGREAQKQ
jgi:hypothetical protein